MVCRKSCCPRGFFILSELLHLRATRPNYKVSLNPAVFHLKHRADLLDRVEAHRDQLFRQYNDAVAQARDLETELLAYGAWVRRRRI